MDFQIKPAAKEWSSDVKCEEAQWFSLTVSVPPLMTVYGRLRVWMALNDFLGKGFLRKPSPPTGTGDLSKQGSASASHLPTHIHLHMCVNCMCTYTTYGAEHVHTFTFPVSSAMNWNTYIRTGARKFEFIAFNKRTNANVLHIGHLLWHFLFAVTFVCIVSSKTQPNNLCWGSAATHAP